MKMNKSFEYLPKDKRKKIVVVCDDIRVHSGIATVAKEIVVGTCRDENQLMTKILCALENVRCS